jgi:hypothetical protein
VLLCALAGAGAAAAGGAAGAGFAPAGGDVDGDGWTPADGDCCDGPDDGCGPEAPWVNPGAFERDGNGLDDDCDGAVDNPLPSNCSATPKLTGLTGTDLARALDLCATTVTNPPLPERRWGVIDAALLRATGTDSDSNLVNFQAAVLADFGPNNLPVANATMATLATKTARDAADPSFQEVEFAPSWLDTRAAPLLLNPPGCPVGSNAVNSARLRLVVRVPTNAVGLAFQTNFFSAEFPEQCQQFNDHALALLTSQAPGIPADGNILFDSVGNPVTTNFVRYRVCTPVTGQDCELGAAGLLNTGFEISATGGATSWQTTTAPVVPGEDIVLELHVYNLVDGLANDVLLIDGFAWNLRPVLLLFVDGFETGDTSRWSLAVP